MTDDKMRDEFEKWADSKCMSLTRINWKDGNGSAAWIVTRMVKHGIGGAS